MLSPLWKVAVVLALVVIAFLIMAPLRGQTCAQPVQYSYTYQQTPVYQQASTYKYVPAQKIVAQEVVASPYYVTVPVESYGAPPYAYASPYYYSSSDAYREKAYLREVLRDELRSLLSQGGQQQQLSTRATTNAAAAVTAPPPAPAPIGAVPPPSTTSAVKSWVPDTTTPPDLQAKVLAAYQGKGNCVSCHGGGGKDSGNFKLVLDDGKGGYALTKQTVDKRWKIYGMASTGFMPEAAKTDASKGMEIQHLPNLLQYTTQVD